MLLSRVSAATWLATVSSPTGYRAANRLGITMVHWIIVNILCVAHQSQQLDLVVQQVRLSDAVALHLQGRDDTTTQRG